MKPYELIETYNDIVSSLEEVRDNVVPACGSSTYFADALDKLTKLRDAELGRFPIQEDFEDRDDYLHAVAKFCRLRSQNGDILSVKRFEVLPLLRTLNAYGRDYGQLMCQEYGDDEDWCGIGWGDAVEWVADSEIPELLTTVETGRNTRRVINFDAATTRGEEIIPSDYQTFELF